MEKISAFMDGELDESEAGAQVTRLKQDPGLRAAWDTYHLVGDSLRGERLGFSRDFTASVSARLAGEATVLAPRRRPLQLTVRRFALPVAASVGGMALVAWLALVNNPFVTQKETLAVNSRSPNVQVASGDVNDYLLAHQQFSSSTALQGVGSYVRTVSGPGMEEKR